MKPVELGRRSAHELESLAEKAASLAADLRKSEPTYALAFSHGIYNLSYDTVRYGRIPSFDGEGIIVMDDGRFWHAIGHGDGNREGFIEFIPLPPGSLSEMSPAEFMDLETVQPFEHPDGGTIWINISYDKHIQRVSRAIRHARYFGVRIEKVNPNNEHQVLVIDSSEREDKFYFFSKIPVFAIWEKAETGA